ncbi:hypothetical protein BU26DRAFT_571985 [Trematosphaeria pertusa]|uniref:Uncharacterized protein n=1 Tax=Trematosphaeria pertusa TaxID=390896 RepID=A0A6A6HTP7_9PLEO|nr:uncharacterized protein BU26DRAFT_571985 [Trematosphaeria pertusa]KAF2241128.1 hypothetical protein BU26DRAFT_571985 [Trematosphaeria pertusa]
MPSTALAVLYSTSGTAGRSRKVTSHKGLHNSDMKQLVRVLCSVPFPSTPEAEKKYIHDLKAAIHSLPSHLRSATVQLKSTEDKETGKVKPGRLCSQHKGLNTLLICNIWAFVKHEFDAGVGHYIYPVIMYGGLTKYQECKARQLEPVLQMWHPEFTVEGSIPPDHEPVIPGFLYDNGSFLPKWTYQENECPACMLARIGSDGDVLAALLSGMVARFSSRRIGKRDEAKSSRIRFVRYWLKACDGGAKLVDEAWDLGEEMRRVRKAWKEHARSTRLKVVSALQATTRPHSTAEESTINVGIDVSEPFNPYSYPTNPSPGPIPRASTVVPESQRSSVVGIDISDPFIPPQSNMSFPYPPLPIPASPRPASSIYTRTTCGGPINKSSTTVNTATTHRPSSAYSNSSPPAPLWDTTSAAYCTSIPLHNVPTMQPSVLTCTFTDVQSEHARYSIASSISEDWDKIPSYSSESSIRPLRDHLPAPLCSSNTSREQAREDVLLPPPPRASVYVGFGEPVWDEELYKDVSPPETPTGDAYGMRAGGGEKGGYDVSPPESPVVGREEREWKTKTKGTTWSGLY